MTDSVGAAVRARKAGLNAVVLASRTAAAVSLALAVDMVIVLILAMFSPRFAVGAGTWLWGGCLLAGLVAGFVRARGGMLDDMRCARWMDERAGGRGLIESALYCETGRGGGPYAQALVREGAALARRSLESGVPLSALGKKGGVALMALATSVAVLFALPYAKPPSNGHEAGGIAALSASAGGDRRTGTRTVEREGRAGTLPAISPETVAETAFPDDKRLSGLLERAIEEGRLDDAQAILDSASRELSDSAGRTDEAGRESNAAARERIERAKQALSGKGAADANGETSGRGSESGRRENGAGGTRGERGGKGGAGAAGAGGTGDGFSEGQSPGNGKDPGKRTSTGESGDAADGATRSPESGKDPEDAGGKSPGGDSSNEPVTDSMPREYGGNTNDPGNEEGMSKGTGLQAGSGSGSARDWGRIRAESGDGKLVIDTDPDASYFGAILPGKGPSATLRGAIADAGRSGESAITRQDLPSDYGDFIRSYFLSLPGLFPESGEERANGKGNGE